MTAPHVLQPGEGEAATFGPISFVLKATSDETKGAYSLVEAIGPSFATAHVHHDREEAFYVIDGEITFLAGDERVKATPGSYLLVPRETMHGFRAESAARLLIMHSPGGFERFFREAAAAIGRGDFDREARDRLAMEVGVTYFDDIEV